MPLSSLEATYNEAKKIVLGHLLKMPHFFCVSLKKVFVILKKTRFRYERNHY